MVSRRLFLVVVPITLLAVFVLAHCGKSNTSTSSSAGATAQPELRLLKPLADIRPTSGSSCRVSQAIALESTEGFNVSGKQLWVRGGGWEDSQVLSNVARHGKSKHAVVVLSATDPNASQGSAYFYQFYQQRLPGYSVSPVHTTRQSAGDPQKVSLIQQAGVIFITGGSPDRLRHLQGTPVGNAIEAAYHEKKVPVYLNSASVSLGGPYFGWDIGREKSARREGLGLVPFPMVSHLEAPQQFGQYLSDLWSLVPSQSPLGFGLTAGTLAVFSGNKVAVYGSNSSHRVYVYDSRLSATEQCHQWYLVPGEVFPAVSE